jgi:membrane-bound lytic murein transglycosylase A
MKKLFVVLLLCFITTACAKRMTKPAVVKPAPPALATQNCDCTQTQNAPIQPPANSNKSIEPKEVDATKVTEFSLLKSSSWAEIDGLLDDDLTAAWGAWLQSCSTLKNKPQWQFACSTATQLNKPNSAAIADYLTTHFDVYAANNLDGSNTGLVTGYYEPLLKGSRKQSAQYPYPLYSVPSDLVTVELADIYPDLKYKRVRGKLVDNKLEGQKLIPYMTRSEIEASPSPLAGNEIVWINDIIDVFFLQIQGSGLVKLDNGEQVHVGYADQNGHTYNSIGRLLVERGELPADQASMLGIKNWARNNLGKLRDLLNSNPSYVFFRELPAGLPGPLGALGVPITAERSVAIDPKFIPLGAPLFLSTTHPNSTKSLKRLMVAQDTGGAIKGGVRADFFWGAGETAGKQAGAMKQQGKVWVMLPKGYVFK